MSISPTEEAMAAGNHVAPDLSHLSAEEKERQHAVWQEELAQIEDEIATLRTVLASKMRRSAELKRNLGITVWKEVTDDINQGIKNVKESNVYQTVETKVGQVTKAVTDAPIYMEVTPNTTIFKEIQVWGQLYPLMRNKLLRILVMRKEETRLAYVVCLSKSSGYQKTSSIIGGTIGNISNKLGQMRHSESFRSIEERVESVYENVKTKVASRSGSQQSLDEAGRSRSGSLVTSPTIPEEKPLA